MININKAQIQGRLTRDPESKKLNTGTTVTSFSVATSETYTKDGEKKESTQYHNVVVFGKTAENCALYLKKGQEVNVEGKLQTRSWEAQDGSKRYVTEINAYNVQFGRSPQKVETRSVAEDHGIEYPKDDINPEDIPF